MRNFLIVSIIFFLNSCDTHDKTSPAVNIADYQTPFEKGNGNQTATYQEVIEFYERLAADFNTVSIEEIGMTDAGKPLHVIHYSNRPIDWEKSKEDHIKILVNNGIHPGESDGIDATMMLVRDLATGKITVDDNVIFSTIAIYNVGGSLNRNTSSRTNQNGPESYGFRGNARNYDLNRDFIKSDTRNARAFATVFHNINPDIFIDNHVSNGADYQYTLTHLFTQHNRLGGSAGEYLHNQLQPALEEALKDRSLLITPYVNVYNQAPEEGFSQFVDYPRYSTGYTSLWNVLGMMVETHMLKPYDDRVYGTKAIMEEMIAIGSADVKKIKKIRTASFVENTTARYYPLEFELDKQKADTLQFLGYEASNNISELTGNPLQTYDRSKPFKKKTPYYNYFKVTDSIKIPDFYVIPQGQWEVIDLMRLNNIEIRTLDQDTTLPLTVYRIKDYQTASRAYEGHYPHSDIVLQEFIEEINLSQDDVIVDTRQPGIKYILETLEPQMPDSFFKWNFFDTILQRKEGFSAYVFEATARKLLSDHPEIKSKFDSLKKTDERFARSNSAQLSWLHERSANYEKAHLRYPIYKSN